MSAFGFFLAAAVAGAALGYSWGRADGRRAALLADHECEWRAVARGQVETNLNLLRLLHEMAGSGLFGGRS